MNRLNYKNLGIGGKVMVGSCDFMNAVIDMHKQTHKVSHTPNGG